MQYNKRHWLLLSTIILLLMAFLIVRSIDKGPTPAPPQSSPGAAKRSQPPTRTGVYRPSTSTFLLHRSPDDSKTVGDSIVAVPFGAQGDMPLAGDWHGNGIASVGVYRPGNSTFY